MRWSLRFGRIVIELESLVDARPSKWLELSNTTCPQPEARAYDRMAVDQFPSGSCGNLRNFDTNLESFGHV